MKLFKPLEPFKVFKPLNFLPFRGLGGFLLLLLLCSCGSKTEQLVGKINDKLPYTVSEGEITAITANEHNVDITVAVNQKFDADWYNKHPQITKKIRCMMLGALNEKTHIGALLRYAHNDGYDLNFYYTKGNGKNKKVNHVEITTRDEQDILNNYAGRDSKELYMLVNLEYLNVNLPHKIDKITTQEKIVFKDGNFIIPYVVDTKDIDWQAVVKSRDSLKETVGKDLAANCKKDESLRSILKQCLSSGYNYVYEYRSQQEPDKNIRFTYTPQEIRGMLF